MINAVIVEDEVRSNNYLKKLLESREITVIKQLFSVEESLEWFVNNEEPDVVFSDIKLGDGLSFEIYDQLALNSKIIFITAFDEFTIQAFKHNSIDYLLKPIKIPELEFALTQLKKTIKPIGLKFENILESSNYRNVFLIKVGSRLKTIKTEDIAFVFSENKTTYFKLKNNEKYMVDYTLEKLLAILSPQLFFQVNRKVIIQSDSIKDMLLYSSTKLKLVLNPEFHEEVFVSRDRIKNFKNWLEN